MAKSSSLNVASAEALPREVFLQRQPDGTLVDWGRHVTVQGVRGTGPARWFRGEAAEVMLLVLQHSKKNQ